VSDNLLVALIITAAMVWVSLTLQKALDRITERLDAIEEQLGMHDDDDEPGLDEE
jgi:ribosome assembly protein YihI (activator of Der GTPase)